ncbi:MAG TPA: hypothetical protein VFG14_14340 [Chthoniobacteraceae bacterium]|nr:hypothetical protein [Chthoniobacteraceae bacterium]
MKTYLLLVILASAMPAFAQSAQRQTGAPGAVKATTRVLPDGSKATNIVNPDKREATETVTDASGKVTKKTWFSLDERDFTTGAVHYDAKGNIRYKEAFKRDGADRITATYLYSKNDQLLGHRIFNYDAKGNITGIDDYDAKGNLIPANNPTQGKSKRRR